MAISPSSSVQQARQELATRLREIRLDARLTGRALAAAAGWHEAKTSRIESARQAPSDADIVTWWQVAAAVAAYNAQVSVPVTARTHAEVTGLLGVLPLVAPGVVPVAQWRPVVAGLPHRRAADLYAGLASVPRGRR